MIKVNYDTETTLVKGYYPDSINYTSIPEPFIEIENNAQILDKRTCVVGGIYQEYVAPESVLLEQNRKDKVFQCKSYLNATDKYFIEAQDTGESDYPQKAARQQAREAIIELKACTTLEELNAININFE